MSYNQDLIKTTDVDMNSNTMQQDHAENPYNRMPNSARNLNAGGAEGQKQLKHSASFEFSSEKNTGADGIDFEPLKRMETEGGGDN